MSLSLKISFLFILFQNITSYSQNLNVSEGVLFDGEPYLISNPNNPQHITVAWIGFVFGQNAGIRIKSTFDGGITWSSAATLPHLSSTYKSADPSLAYDNEGNLFACYVDYRQDPDSGGVVICKSIDGGLNWIFHSQAMDAYDDGSELPIDRPWLAINPINNQFYLTTKPAPWIPAPNRPYIINSSDGGLTWQPWQYLDATGFLTGSFLSGPMAALDVSTSGILHTIYPSYVLTQNFFPGFIHASSTDGEIFDYHPAYFAATNGGDPSAKVGYTLRTNPSNPTHLAFVFVSKLNTDLDIFLIESFDSGITWTNPYRVNDDAIDNGKVQDLAWLDFNNEGDMAIAWRDRRNGSATGYADETEIWASIRQAGESAFSANFAISDVAAPYIEIYQEASGNDFMCIDYSADTLTAVWSDVRNNVLDLWFERRVIGGSVLIDELISSEEFPSVVLFPNPTGNELNLSGKNLISARLFDMNGKLLMSETLSNENKLNISSLAKGKYTITIETRTGNVLKSFIKER